MGGPEIPCQAGLSLNRAVWKPKHSAQQSEAVGRQWVWVVVLHLGVKQAALSQTQVSWPGTDAVERGRASGVTRAFSVMV